MRPGTTRSRVSQKRVQASGAQKRKARRLREQLVAEVERAKSGANAKWSHALDALGPVPLDAIENVEWANNVAATMAWLIARDATIHLPERFKRVAELLDRVFDSQAKASVARRIRLLSEGLGAPQSRTTQPKGNTNV